MATARTSSGSDRGAAVTRSMLAWGVVVGPFHLRFVLKPGRGHPTG